MREFAIRLWRKVHEPRVISVAQSLIYLAFVYGGVAALLDPPRTIEGQVGVVSMMTLAAILAFGGLLGAPTALLGIWWLERVAVMAVVVSAVIYGWIVISLHIAEPGNRQLQFVFVVVTLLGQFVRWHRIRERPYDPDRHY